MACNCGNTSSNVDTASTAAIPALPNPSAPKAPNGVVLGTDGSRGGTVPFYGSPGGSVTSTNNGGGYVAAATDHSLGLNGVVKPPNPNVNPNLGGLSARYESGGKGAGAIGQDRNGGWSYGTYQISTAAGTMDKYLPYLQSTDPTAYAALQAAGGSSAALAGDPAFKEAWQNLATTDPNFAQNQHDFIQATHYDVAADNLLTNSGLDISQRSIGVQNAVWSTAVQNGPNSAVFSNALAGRNVSSMSDADIINALYDERGRTNSDGTLVYFQSSTPNVQQSVKNRFVSERAGALAEVPNSVSPTTPLPTNVQTGI